MRNEEKIMDTPYVHYLVIAIVCCFGFFVNNQVIPADLMESRNLATAQEMVRTGEYLIPRMNGDLRLEKPPLPTWVAAGIEHIAPGNLIVQRYAAGVMATIMVVFLYLLVTELTRNRKTALFSSVVLATCFNVVLLGRTATWDIYCHSFMLGAIYFLVLALKQPGAQWKNFLLTGLFMGLSFLSKGPVSFYALLLAFIIAFGVTYRPSLKGKVAPLIVMIVLCVIISSWWTVYLLLTHPEMMLFVAHKESTSWLGHNVRPWYYYWQFAAEAGIWALFLITAIANYLIRRKFELKSVYTFAFTWFFSSLILLSLIPEKKTRYLLPILIPASILVGLYIYYCVKNLLTSLDKVLFKINATLIAVILIALPVALYIMFYKDGEITTLRLVIVAILSWGLCAYILISTYGKAGLKAESVFWGVILTMVMIVGVCLGPIGDMFINEDRNSIRMIRQIEKIQGMPFFYNQDEELRMELVYEANQTIRPMDVTDNSQIYSTDQFVFVSGEPADSIFAGKNVTIEELGTFDNNWRKTGHRKYNWQLVRHVAIVTKNQQSAVSNDKHE